MQESDPHSSQDAPGKGAEIQPPHRSDSDTDARVAEASGDPDAPGGKDADGSEKPKPPARDGGLRLVQVVAMNGQNLTRAIASLTKRRGKRAVYAETTFEEFTKSVKELVDDPKGALRLRTILGLGLQQGAKRPSSDAFWTEFLHLVDSFLRQIDYPRVISIEGGTTPIDPDSYRNLWHSITVPEEGNATKGAKEIIAALEVVLLDVMTAHWKDRLSSDAVLEAISHLELPGEINDPFHCYLPWTPASSLATGLPAPIVVAQAGAVHDHLERVQRSHREAAQRVAQLEEELAATSEELVQTRAALDKESSLLQTANHTIEQLQLDLQAAGAIHRHRADELRSRYKGLLEGDLDRHLETIQRAAGMIPPRGSVIIERVETLLETINRELKWLNDSE